MFASVWVALLPLSLVSAHVGVLLWVWVALLVPNELLIGFMAGVPFNKIIAIITLVVMCLNSDKRDPYIDKVLTLLLLFALAVTISWSTGIVSDPNGDDLYQKVIKVIVLCFTIATMMSTRHRIHLLVLVIALSTGFLAVEEGLIAILSGGGHKIVGSGSVGDNNSLATALLMVIPLMLYLARYSALPAVRLGLWAATGLSIVTVIMTFSRGGFIGLIVLGAFTIKNNRNKLAGTILVAATGALIFLLAPHEWFDRLDTIEAADNDSSFMGRVVAWKISLLIALDHPFFGGGLHAVQRFFVWDTYKQGLFRVNFVNTPLPDDRPHAAHSIYFEVLGDLGFIGLAMFLTILGMTLWNCNRICRISKSHPALAWAGDLARALQIGLVVYVVTAAALSMAYFELLYILIALVSRCRRTVELTVAGSVATGSPSVTGATRGPALPRPARWRSLADRYPAGPIPRT